MTRFSTVRPGVVLHDRETARRHGVEDQLADAGAGKDDPGKHGARQQLREAHPDQRDGRRDRDPQSMAEHHPVGRQAEGTGRAGAASPLTSGIEARTIPVTGRSSDRSGTGRSQVRRGASSSDSAAPLPVPPEGAAFTVISSRYRKVSGTWSIRHRRPSLPSSPASARRSPRARRIPRAITATQSRRSLGIGRSSPFRLQGGPRGREKRPARSGSSIGLRNLGARGRFRPRPFPAPRSRPWPSLRGAPGAGCGPRRRRSDARAGR